MIYYHLPDNEKSKFLRQPIKMTQYLHLPKLHPIYFQLNLDLINPRYHGQIDLLQRKSYALVLIRARSDVNFLAKLKLNDQEIEGGHRVIFDNKNQYYFAPNIIGKHKITIFGKRSITDEGKYNVRLDLNLNITSIIKILVVFQKHERNILI